LAGNAGHAGDVSKFDGCGVLFRAPRPPIEPRAGLTSKAWPKLRPRGTGAPGP
jgi:hypothetical protein